MYNSAVSETLHATILSLLDASYQASDLATLDETIAKLIAAYPEDPELPKALFSRAQILKKDQEIDKAKKELENLLVQFPDFQQRPQVIFELTHLDYKAKAWGSCYRRAQEFLKEFPDHELNTFAQRYFLSSSLEIATENPEFKERLVEDLQNFLALPLSESEKKEWELVLAKTFYELKQYTQASALLQQIHSPNAHLLLALCHRDSSSDIQTFCEMGEQALSDGADLIDKGQIHACLYNGYLELSDISRAAEHLYAAFMAKAPIKRENLLWLADLYLSQLEEDEGNFSLAHRTALVLDKCKAALHDDEEVICKLAKVYAVLGRTDDEIALLESLETRGIEAELLLAESYARKGVVERATEMFDAIVSTGSTLRSKACASASLQGARLKLASENPDLTKIAMQLKTLVIQKNFEGEPVYLEAALDYVDVQAKTDAAKRVSLLQKTKLDFERRDDLLSKDYHEARARSPRKDKVYQGYLQLIDAEILAAGAMLDEQNRKDLRSKAKDILHQIVNEQSATALLERARVLQLSIDETQAKQ
jgi:tetratricopeptide (TPR) repeat protein